MGETKALGADPRPVEHVTASRRAEAALRESEERFRLLFEHMSDGLAYCRIQYDGDRPVDYTFLEVNPAFEVLTGLKGVVGKKVSEVVPGEADPGLIERYERVARLGTAERFETYVKSLGQWFDISVYSPARGDFIAVFDVITDRKRAEEMLRGTLQRFYSVLSSIFWPILLVAPDERVEFANPAFCEEYRVRESPDELVGLGASEMAAKMKEVYLRPEEATARVMEIIRRGQPVKGEEVVLRDGRTFLRDFVPLNVSGEPGGRLWLSYDITGRKHAEEALREEDRRKAEFLAVLSHELRNPLAPIRNSIYLLERAAPGTKQATRATEVIRRQTEHLTRLIDDLLDVTRISRGKVVLKRTRVDLRDIVRRTTGDLRSVFAQARVALHADDVFRPTWIIADPTRITQALGNLLQNAVKFTPAGGSVTVTVTAKGDHAELRVRDTGVGMEPGAIQHMFDPFVQAERTLARTKGGLGLGLALVKGIVELHGGTVEAHSDGVGSGAEFVVRLPLAELGAEKGHERPRTVLVIEDNLDAGQTLAEVLELQGLHARVARDGRSGLELAHDLHPDVVLCDIGLPDIDGYEVARELRCDEALRATLLIALGGYAQPEDPQRAREAGFDAHIAKPADIDTLTSVIASGG
jgi:PAS domain S-box-containing protein